MDHCLREFSEGQRNAIIESTSAFLKKYFHFDVNRIKVLADSRILVLQVEDFVSPAELELAKKNRDLIEKMYSRVFYRVIRAFVEPIEQELRKKVLSCRMQVDVQTRDCIITVTLSPERIGA